MRGVYIQQPESLSAAKNMAEKLELTHLATSEQREHTNVKKTSNSGKPSIEAPRRGDLRGDFIRRLAVSEDRDRFQIRSEREAAYLLIEEHERLAVRIFMDRQLCGDPF